MDGHEARSWHGRHRHVTLSMLALVFLAAVRAAANAAGTAKKSFAADTADRTRSPAPATGGGLASPDRGGKGAGLVGLAAPAPGCGATRPLQKAGYNKATTVVLIAYCLHAHTGGLHSKDVKINSF